MRDAGDIANTMKRHADTVARVCALHLANRPDRDDAFQETLIRYARSDKEFSSDEHRKAWLIRVAANVCKDLLKSAAARVIPLGDIDEAAHPQWQDGQPGIESSDRAEQLNAALMQLDERYRMMLYLKYYEGYKATQIAEMLGIPENTVYTNLARGREKLKEVLSDD